MYVCMYVCMYVSLSLYLSLSIYLSISLSLYIYIHTHIDICICICICVCIYIYIYIYICAFEVAEPRVSGAKRRKSYFYPPVLPLSRYPTFIIPKVTGLTFFPNQSKYITFAAAPLVLTPFVRPTTSHMPFRASAHVAWVRLFNTISSGSYVP